MRCPLSLASFPGVSKARNEGAAAARQEILVYCDYHMRATPSWYGTFVRALAQAGSGTAVTGHVVAGESEAKDGFAPAIAPGDTRVVYEGPLDTDVLAGCNMAIYRSALDDVGGFDERLGPGTRLPGAEDMISGSACSRRATGSSMSPTRRSSTARGELVPNTLGCAGATAKVKAASMPSTFPQATAAC